MSSRLDCVGARLVCADSPRVRGVRIAGSASAGTRLACTFLRRGHGRSGAARRPRQRRPVRVRPADPERHNVRCEGGRLLGCSHGARTIAGAILYCANLPSPLPPADEDDDVDGGDDADDGADEGAGDDAGEDAAVGDAAPAPVVSPRDMVYAVGLPGVFPAGFVSGDVPRTRQHCTTTAAVAQPSLGVAAATLRAPGRVTRLRHAVHGAFGCGRR
jgi:hypothetical protein